MSNFAPAGKPPPVRLLGMEYEQLAFPMTVIEQKADRKRFDQLHPGNRFPLMFGQPLLPQGQWVGRPER
jgi:hypothetical protein